MLFYQLVKLEVIMVKLLSEMKYTLIKLSSPGFDLNTNHIGTVQYILDFHVCNMCRLEEEWPEDYNSLAPMEQVNVLLSTPCGAEFMLEENNVK